MSERESRHVRIGGLPDGATDERIIAHFNPYGNVAKVSRPCDGSGDVVVSYNDIRSAKKAIDAINGRASPRGKFDGFALRIAFSESIPSTPTTSVAGDKFRSLLFHALDGGKTSARTSASSDQPSTFHNVVLPTPLASTSQPLPQVAGPAGPKLGVAQADIGSSSKTSSKLAAVTKRVFGSAPAAIVTDPLHKNASRTLYVGNLPSGVTDDQLRAIFIPYGHILNYDVKSRHGASPTAFIEFSNIRAVAQILRAVAGNSRFTIGNKRLELNWGSSVRTTKLWIGALPSTCSQQYLLSKLRVIERAEEVTELIYDERHCEALALYKTTDASQFAYKRIKSRGLTFPCEASDDEGQCCEVDFCSERLHDFFVDRQFGRVPRASRSRINATAAPPDPPLGALSEISSIRRESSIDEQPASTTSATMVPPDPIITARTSTGHQPPRERGRTESASRSVIGGNGTHRPRVSIPSADRPVHDEVDRRGGAGGGRKVIRPPSPDAIGGRMANRDVERAQADRRSGNSSRECESRSGSRGRKDFITPRRDHSDAHHRDWERQQSLSSVRERGGRDEKSKSVSSSDRHQSSGVGGRKRDEYATQASSASSNKRVRSSSSSSSTTSSSTTCSSSRSTSSGCSASINRTKSERKAKAAPESALPGSSASQNPSPRDGGRLRQEARATATAISTSRSERREGKAHSPLSGTLLCPPPPAPIIGAKTPRSRQHSGSSSASSMLERSSVAGKGIEEKLAVIHAKLRDRRGKEESDVGRKEQRKPERDRKVEPKEPTSSSSSSSSSSNIHHSSSSSAARQPAERLPTHPIASHSTSSHPTSGHATSSRTPVKKVPTSPLYRHMSDPRLRKSDSSPQCPPISLSIPRFGTAFLAKYGRTTPSTSNNQPDEWNTSSFEEPHVGREVAAAPCSSRMMSVSSLHCEESVSGPGDSGASVSHQWTASTASKQEGVSLLSRDSSTDSMLDTPPPMVAVSQFDISAFRLSCFLGRGDILLAWRDRLAAMRVRLDEAEKEKERVLNDEVSHQSRSTNDYEDVVSSVSLQEELERFRTAKGLRGMKTAPATHPHHFDFAATKGGQELSGWSAPPTSQPSGAFFPDVPVLARRETDAARASPSSFGFGLFDTSSGGGRDHRSRESSSIPQSPSHPPVGKFVERSYGAALHKPAAVTHSTSNRSSTEPQSANTAVTSAKPNKLTHASKTAVADPRRKPTYDSPALTSFSPQPKHSSTTHHRLPPKEASRHDVNQMDDFFHKQASSWPFPSAIASTKQEKRLTSSSSTDQAKSPFVKTPTGPSSQSLHQHRQSTSVSSSSKVLDRLDKSAREHKTSKHPSVSADVRGMSKEHAKRKEKERHAGKSESELKEKERRKKKRFTSANSSEDSEEDTDDEEAMFGLGGIDMEEQRRIMQQITSGKCGTTMYDRVKQRSSAMRPDQQRKKEQALKRIEKMRERSGLKKKKLQRVQLPSSSSSADDDSEESSRVSAGRSERHQEEVAADVSDDDVSLASHSTVQSRSEALIPSSIKVPAKTCIVGDVKVEMAPVEVEVESGNATERKTAKDDDATFCRSRTTPKKGVEDAKKRTKKGNKNELLETTPKSQSDSLIVDNDSSPAEASSSGRSGSESEGEACVRRLQKELLKYHRSSEEEAEAESRFETAMECIFPNEDHLDMDDSSSADDSSSSSPSLDEKTSQAPILKKEVEESQAAAVKSENAALEQPPTKRAKLSTSSGQVASVSEGMKEPAPSTVPGRRPTMEKTPSVEDGKRREVPRRGRPPKTTRKHSVDETETKRQEEKRIVEILHSLCPKTNSSSTSTSTDVMTTATATANYEPPPSAMVKQTSGTGVENVEMEDILGIAFASADVCSGFEVVDQGRIGVEKAGVSTTSTTPTTTITSPSIVTPAATGRAPVVKRGRGRPPKNKTSLLKNQSKSCSFEEPAAQTTVTSEEELKRRAEIMRKMREEEEAAAAMSLTQGGVQESSRDTSSKEVETGTKEGRNASALEAEPTSAAVHEMHEVGDIKSPKHAETFGASRGGYVEVDAEHLLQQQQPPQLHHQHQQQAAIDETEKKERVPKEEKCEKAVTGTKCREEVAEEDEERRRLEEEHEDRLTATVDAVIASSKIAAAETTTSHDLLLRSRCATVRPITVAAATPQVVKAPPHSPPAASYAVESVRGEAISLSAQPDVKRSVLPVQSQLPSPVHAGSTRTKAVTTAVNTSHYQNKPTTTASKTQLPSVPSSQRLPSSAHQAFLNTHATATPGISGELTRPDSNVPPFPANSCAGSASVPPITPQPPVSARIPAEIPLALADGLHPALYGHLLGNPSPSYSQLLSPNHQQHATFLMNQLIASQRWNPAVVASIQQASISPSAPLPANSIPIDMLQQIRAEIERQQQADAGRAHLARSPSTPLHQPFGVPQSHQLHHSPSLSNHPAELQQLVEADSSVEQIQSQYPVLWQGRLTLKNAHTFVEMHKICGNGDFVYAMEEELMSHIDGYKTIKITQKMRLSEDQLQSILLRISNNEDYVGLCCIPCGRNEDEITSQSESMRHSFIEFLMEKQAAGIINQGPGGTPASCVVHVFPPVKFVYEIMMRHAPDLLVRVEEIDDWEQWVALKMPMIIKRKLKKSAPTKFHHLTVVRVGVFSGSQQASSTKKRPGDQAKKVEDSSAVRTVLHILHETDVPKDYYNQCNCENGVLGSDGMNQNEKDPGWQFLRLAREKLLQEQSRPYDSKKNVWIPDQEDGYVEGEITSTKGDMVTVNCKGGEMTLKRDLVQEMNPPKYEKTEDASVLHNLRSRYSAMLIYTYSGLFCVVINPYKRLPIYTESVARMYIGKRRTEMPPHLFAVSDEAYRNMLQNRENQSMLITGESGAGKTENTKKVIAYFASVGASQQEQPGAAVSAQKKVTLEDQIVQTNPVLEAFGNAKTVRNNNSSRFGKFIRIHFNRAGRVASCDIEHYLLEKSRVIRQAPGERCYHIFYQIFSGHIPDLKKRLKLGRPLNEYIFVAQAELTIDGVDDKEEFRMTDEAFDVLNFSQKEKDDCYRLMSGIMHMGCMKFKQRPREEQAEVDETEEAQFASDMFGVDNEQLLMALVKPRVRVGNEWVSKGQNVDQVSWAIGAMAKALYARVFEWLVKKCNLTLDQKGLSRDYFIGVLDIAGFEIFDFNSFEQLWINFVNEKLQQFFNHHMFVLEQEEYSREGIAWTFIDFGLDLQACIELIEKPMGIISMLDEECIVPKASDQTLAQKLCEQHLGKHANFEKPKPPKGKQGEAHFAMRHYAGTVRYNCSNWLEKNKDPLNDTLVSVLKSAKGNELLLEVWANYQTQEEAVVATKSGAGAKKKGKSGSFLTVSMIYRESLTNLMSMLNKTHPHFIRCIIPNEKKTSGMIDAALVLNQLTCNGVLEGIRICRKGFPNRTFHKDFKVRYGILAAEAARSSEDPKTAATAILDKLVDEKQLSIEQFKIGHTKIFFKSGVLATIEELRDVKQTDLVMNMQRVIRCYLAKMDLKKRLDRIDSYGIIQRNIRAWFVLRVWDWYLLFNKIKPMLTGVNNKHEEELKKMEEELKTVEQSFAKEEEARKRIEEEHAKLLEERKILLDELERSKSGGTAVEEKVMSMNAEKVEIERKLVDMKDRLNEQQQRSEDAQRQTKKAEKEKTTLSDQIAQLGDTLARVEEEKDGTEQRLNDMNDVLAKQDEQVGVLSKEKKKREEENRRLAETLQAEAEKNSQAKRGQLKLEKGIEEIEDNLERERRGRMEVEKARKKVEAELMAAQERVDETNRIKAEIESKQLKVEEELRELSTRLEDLQPGKYQRKLKEQASRLIELEEELEAERSARTKTDKGRSALQVQLEEVNDSIEDQNSKIGSQLESAKKKDSELARYRKELEELNQRNENELAALRKKNTDELAVLTDRLEAIQKAKAKADSDKENIRRQLDDVSSQITLESRGKSEQERVSKNVEAQVMELQTKCDEQHRLIQDLTATKGRLQTENTDSETQMEELGQHLTQLSKRKAQAQAQLEEAKRALDEEHAERQTLVGVTKNLEHDIERVKDNIAGEVQQKEEILKQLSKARAEVQQWKAKFDGEGLVALDEMENERRRRLMKKLEVQETLQEVSTKIMNVEKINSKLIADAEEARTDVERNRTIIMQLEKKQESFDKIIEDWHRQCDDLTIEIEKTQNESRRSTAEIYALQTASTSLYEQVDELRRESKSINTEIRDLNEQLATSVRNAHEFTKKVRMLELEKEEVQHALDETEAALEIEESKVLRVQSEVGQIRAEIDRRINEKMEDFENTQKNHQRALESIRSSLDNELKGKNALLQTKKKLESDINDFELQLDMTNKTNAEAQRNLKRLIAQIQELQLQVEEEQRRREEFRENYLVSDQKLNIVVNENNELTLLREQMEHQKHKLESEVNEQRIMPIDHSGEIKKSEIQAENLQLAAAKRAVENDLQLTKSELDKSLGELKQVEESYKKVSGDLTRLAEELRQEQQHREHVDRLRKGHELQVKELQSRLEQAETTAQRVGQRAIDNLQRCIRSREQELDLEQKHYKDTVKQLSKCEREVRERKFELEEHKKTSLKMQDLLDKLQAKIKTHKKQLEEAEEVSAMNLAKYKQMQTALDHAEERADEAENSLVRAKSRIRVNGLGVSASSGALLNGGDSLPSSKLYKSSSGIEKN